MTMNRDTALALQVTLAGCSLDQYPAGTCPAWIDARDAACGRATTRGGLCARHHTVAERRLAKAVIKRRDLVEQVRVERERRRPGREAELARIESRLDSIDPFRASGRGDVAEVNTPLSSRIPTDARIAELADLHKRRAHLRRALGLDPD